jgi:hypothetical protein
MRCRAASICQYLEALENGGIGATRFSVQICRDFSQPHFDHGPDPDLFIHCLG